MTKKNFGDILKIWENSTGTSYNIKNKKQNENKKQQYDLDKIMEAGLKKYGIHNKDLHKNNIEKTISKKELLKMKPQATIDLHGMTIAESQKALDIFFVSSKARDLKKILIIHGKGIHSKEEPILKKFIKQYLEQQSLAGENGYSKKSDGGSGSTWVILK